MNAQKTTKILKENKNSIFLAGIVIISLILLYYLLFGLLGMKPRPAPQATKTYQTLDKTLNQVVNSNDSKAVAEKNNLAVEGNGVKALITLKDESFVFTDMYGKEVLRYGKYIQAVIKFEKLEELAKNPKIGSIKAPLKNVLPSK